MEEGEKGFEEMKEKGYEEEKGERKEERREERREEDREVASNIHIPREWLYTKVSIFINIVFNIFDLHF